MLLQTRQLQRVLVVALAALSVWAAIQPVSRVDWFIENLFVWIAAVLLISLRNRVVLSTTASLSIALFVAMQVYASHFAYQPALGASVSSLFGSERNSFDRVMHLASGLLLLVPMAELLEGAGGLSRKGALFSAVVALTALGAVYEIVEWGSMIVLAPQEAALFVGLQGDPWDAQKDMGLALLGSFAAFVLVRTRGTFTASRAAGV